MSERLIVVGAGLAGLSACAQALMEKWNVTLIDGGAGASAMMSGAADLYPWKRQESVVHREEGRLSQRLESAEMFLRSLKTFRPGTNHVITGASLIRPTRAVGRGVLGLKEFAGKLIGIADVRRSDFRAAQISSDLSSQPWATATGTRFQSVQVRNVFSEHELDYPQAHFARLLDKERRPRFAAQLVKIKEETPEIAALVVGPWLGERGADEDWILPVGETLSPPDGSFGVRFELDRAAWISRNEVEFISGEVNQVRRAGSEISVVSKSKDGMVQEFFCDAVVVATGGLIGGGRAVMKQGRLGVGTKLGSSIFDSVVSPSGEFSGWDPAQAPDEWLGFGGACRERKDEECIQLAGDARGGGTTCAPLGTVYGAIVSGMNAVSSVTGAKRGISRSS